MLSLCKGHHCCDYGQHVSVLLSWIWRPAILRNVWIGDGGLPLGLGQDDGPMESVLVLPHLQWCLLAYSCHSRFLLGFTTPFHRGTLHLAGNQSAIRHEEKALRGIVVGAMPERVGNKDK